MGGEESLEETDSQSFLLGLMTLDQWLQLVVIPEEYETGRLHEGVEQEWLQTLGGLFYQDEVEALLGDHQVIQTSSGHTVETGSTQSLLQRLH